MEVYYSPHFLPPLPPYGGLWWRRTSLLSYGSYGGTHFVSEEEDYE
jgi:hypothetical protein